MRCEQARKQMSLMLDEMLTPEQRSELEWHLRECVGCRAEWRLLKTVQRLMATTKPAPLPYDLTPIVMERIRALERERKTAPFSFWRSVTGRWRWLALAVAPLVLVLAFFGVGIWRGRNPVNLPTALYWSVHMTNVAKVAVTPELAPISVALSPLPFAGDER